MAFPIIILIWVLSGIGSAIIGLVVGHHPVQVVPTPQPTISTHIIREN
jgi:uncharacterized membrane protein